MRLRFSNPHFFIQRIRQARIHPIRARNGVASSTSVSSDSQGLVGVSHGFLCLMTILREVPARVSLWKCFSISWPFVLFLSVPWLSPCFCPAMLFPPLRHAAQEDPELCLHSRSVQRWSDQAHKRYGTENENKIGFTLATCCETQKHCSSRAN